MSFQSIKNNGAAKPPVDGVQQPDQIKVGGTGRDGCTCAMQAGGCPVHHCLDCGEEIGREPFLYTGRGRMHFRCFQKGKPGSRAGVSRPAGHVAERVDPGPARSGIEHAEALEHMARYRRDGRTGTRSVADLAEAESCDAGAAALRELIEMNQILARIGKRG